MTIMYKKFQISVTNIESPATEKLTCPHGERIKLLFIGIAPGASEDSWIKVYRDQEDLTGNGIFHSVIDDYTHQVPFDIEITEGQSICVSAYGPTAKTIHGVYAYEITTV